mgnify:CR=1 FL=1
MAKAIHSMIRVLDENRSVDFYRRAFGLEIASRLDFDDFTLIYLSNSESGFELELTVNKGRTEPYQLGDGYGHLAVSVADLDGEHARFQISPPAGRFWRGFSLWPTRTDTRSRSCNGADAINKTQIKVT